MAYEMRISDWSSDVCSSDLFKYLRVQSVLRDSSNRIALRSLTIQGGVSDGELAAAVPWSGDRPGVADACRDRILLRADRAGSVVHRRAAPAADAARPDPADRRPADGGRHIERAQIYAKGCP